MRQLIPRAMLWALLTASALHAAENPPLPLVSQVSRSATGLIGPGYLIFTSTNLPNWQRLFTTNPAAMPVAFTDPNRRAAARFYRLQLGP